MMKLFRKLNQLTDFKYERYLPTAFDNSLTLLEKIDKVIEFLNVVIETTNKIGEYVEEKTIEQDKKIKDLRNEFEELKEYMLNGGLEENVINVLNDWYDSGKLSEIINNEVLGEITSVVKENKRANEYFWTAPEQPSARTDEQGYFIDAFNVTANEIITNYMEPLRLFDTKYITRDNQGKDSSGTYDIYRYKFTPKNYKKTLIIDTAMHGGEITTLLIMLRFLHHLVNDWQKYPILADIRQNVRIIYTPLVNPWGFDDRLNSNTVANGRKNSNGVDINRNFSYLFEEQPTGNPGDIDYKGTSAFSEKESQYVKKTLEDYKNAVGYLNLHNTGTPSYDVYIPYAKNMNPSFFGDLIDYWVRDINQPIINVAETNKSSGPNFAYNEIGVKGIGLEWNDRRTGGKTFSSKDITDGLTWVANFIFELCKIEKTNNLSYEIYYRTNEGDKITINPTGYWNGLSRLKELISIPGDGILMTHCTVKIRALGDGELQICPMLGQGGNGTGLLYDDKQLGRWDETLKFQNGEENTYSFSVSIPVKATTISNDVTRAGVGINAFATGSSFELLSYNSTTIYYESTNNVNVFSHNK